MNQDDIQQYIDGQQNKNTMKKTAREIAQVTKFLKLKNEHKELHQIHSNELDPLLATNNQKKDGSEFEPSALRSIVSASIQNSKDINMDTSLSSTNDDAFRLPREALLAK